MTLAFVSEASYFLEAKCKTKETNMALNSPKRGMKRTTEFNFINNPNNSYEGNRTGRELPMK